MAGVRLGQAFAAGFVLIRRRPLAVFAWGVLILLLVEAPLLYLLGRTASEFLPLFSRPAPLSPADANAFAFGLQERMAPIQAIMLPTLIVRAVIVAAVYRSVLEPGKRAFASLRLGRQEAWLFFLTLTFMALGYLAAIPIDLAVLAAIFGATLLRTPFNLIGPAVLIVGLLVGIWAIARLSLAAPMTFADRRFRLFESWSETRRHGLQLVALGVMLFLFLFGTEIVIGGIVFASVVAVGGGWPIDAERVRASIESLRVLDLRQAAVWLAPLAVVAAAVFGAMSAIAIAPWASAYQQLIARPSVRA